MKTKLMFACSLFAAAVSAQAENGFYVLGSVGQSHFDVDNTQDDIDGLLTDADSYSSTVDKSDTGYKLQVGYQFNENFAVEGGYVDLGEATYKGSASGKIYGYGVSGEAKGKRSASGFNLDALLTLPVNAGFSLFAKVGVINAKVEDEVRGYAEGTVGGKKIRVDEKFSHDSTSLKAHFGIGVAYEFTKQLSARVEIERFNGLGEDKTLDEDIKIRETNVDLYSVGLSYHF